MYSFPVKKTDEPETFADLHLHTIYSDGTYTPQSLIQTAKAREIQTVSVTDHDSVSGVEETLLLGKKHGIEVVPGIELSCSHEGKEVHVLGYFVDHKNPTFLKKLNDIRGVRVNRMGVMIQKVKDLGVQIDGDNFFKEEKTKSVGRLHLAKYMVKKGFAPTLHEVFRLYLGDNKPAFASINALTIQEGFELIHKYGGIPVLAHPGITRKDDLLPQMIQWGLLGIEVFTPAHSNEAIKTYSELALKYNLAVTGGSDCHGLSKKERFLGKVKLPQEKVEALKSFLSGTHSASKGK